MEIDTPNRYTTTMYRRVMITKNKTELQHSINIWKEKLEPVNFIEKSKVMKLCYIYVFRNRNSERWTTRQGNT